MDQIKNNRGASVVLPNGKEVPVGGAIDITGAEWESMRAHPIVQHWLSAGELTHTPGKPAEPTKPPGKGQAKPAAKKPDAGDGSPGSAGDSNTGEGNTGSAAGGVDPLS